jgi:hypothetical protein
MSMKFRNSLAAVIIIFSACFNAQNNGVKPRDCGTGAPPEEWTKWFNAQVDLYKASRSSAQRSSMPANVIPVIVHIIHGGQNIGIFPNITVAQVNSQISVLNKDFAGTGYNANTVPAAFANLISNTGISFCLAQFDPNGNALSEIGIDRINYVSQGWNNPNSYSSQSNFITFMDNTVKPATIWDPSRYLNIWVSDVSQSSSLGLLGYATFPAGTSLTGIQGNLGTASTDGVWVYTRSFGNTGFVTAPYDKGRTATHEIGHYLGLRHVWGDGSTCSNNTDYCSDTPSQLAMNSGCPAYPHVSCSNSAQGGDMFMNFMDYCDDACLYMFTPDQNARMQTALAFSNYRKNLSASSATTCNQPSQVPAAMFEIPNTEYCMDSLVIINNQSTGMPGPTYTWSANPANGANFSPSQSVANPTITFSIPGNYTITVIAANSNGSNSATNQVFIEDCSPEGLHDNPGAGNNAVLVPNPTAGDALVRLKLNGQAGLQIDVYNTLGQVVSSQQLAKAVSGDYPLNVSDQPAGIYIVAISAGSERVVRRLIVSR